MGCPGSKATTRSHSQVWKKTVMQLKRLFLVVPELAAGWAFPVNGEGEGYVEGLRVRILLVQRWVWHRLGGRGIQLELTGSKGVIH